MSMAATASPSVCVLYLNSDGAPKEDGLLKVPLGSKLRFRLDVGCMDLSTVTLWTNFPVRGGKFIRTQFQRVACAGDQHTGFRPGDEHWDTDIDITQPGAFEFFFEYRMLDWGPHLVKPARRRTGVVTGPISYFMVDPHLVLNREPLPLEAVYVQTVLTRCVGRVDEWLEGLEVSSLSEYNMIHFTPVQQLGESGSCYSIARQLVLEPTLFSDTVLRRASGACAGAAGDGAGEEVKIAFMQQAVAEIENKLGMLSMVDVVLNHTASNSPWLVDHPEAAYNLSNSPALAAAVELDNAILAASLAVANGEVEGVSPVMNTGGAIDAVVDHLRDEVLPKYRIWEYYQLDVDACVSTCATFTGDENELLLAPTETEGGYDSVEALSDWLYNRGIHNIGTASRFPVALVNPEAAAMASVVTAVRLEDVRAQVLRAALERVNMRLTERYTDDISRALGAIRGGAKHMWLSERKGKGALTPEKPLVWSYFTRMGDHVFANNGFIWGGDPEIDFTFPVDVARAESQVHDVIASHSRVSSVSSDDSLMLSPAVSAARARPQVQTPLCTASTPYMRRDIVVWGDCVKLRYGKSPSDSPWLWNHMKKYTETMARIFQAFRLDNAHGTPLHVAAYMVDQARSVRPNLYLCAELFTGDIGRDVRYATKLAINGLVREAMQANDAKHLASLIHSYGGHPIASVRSPAAAQARCVPTALPTLFFDCTHDNPTPHQKHHAANALPLAALVSAACCGVGSVRGFDELVPENLSVVSERRRYRTPSHHVPHHPDHPALHTPLMECGLHPVRHRLNRLRWEAAKEQFVEIHVHHDNVPNGDVVTVQRAHPSTRESLVFICRTAFFCLVRNLELAARLTVPENQTLDVALRASTAVCGGASGVPCPSDNVITGLMSSLLVSEDVFEDLCTLEVSEDKTMTTVHLRQGAFRPGSVLIFRVASPHFFHIHGSPHVPYFAPPALPLVAYTSPDLRRSVSWPRLRDPGSYGDLEAALTRHGVDLVALNILLFRSEPEERDASRGARGVYHVPRFGPLSWAGIEGAEMVLRTVRLRNDMGHPFFDNIRHGDWFMDYVVDRLDGVVPLAGVRSWISDCFDIIKSFPPGLKPQAVDRVIFAVHTAAREAALTLMSNFALHASHQSFVRRLLMTSVAMFGDVPSAPLLAPALLINAEQGAMNTPQRRAQARSSCGASLAAGHPHFTTGFMRNWGRDTFISLRGLLLVTGRYEDAANVILSYASVVRHGMVPNLMDGGRNPRYNARDATWWFCQAVQDYCELVPGGTSLLQRKVVRRFPSDNEADYDNHKQYTKTEPVHTLMQIIQEILQKHASGIDFVEWNAGPRLDAHMKPEGFKVRVSLDPTTGLLQGGSVHNCGTWMDKMGESPAHGTDGVPATPRDGAPVEITAMLFTTVSWLAEQAMAGTPGSKPGVTLRDSTFLPFQAWADVLRSNVERLYFVPLDSSEDAKYVIDKRYVNRRGILKDTVGGAQGWTDYQLRPNQAIALALAPELFSTPVAQAALRSLERLLGPDQMGVRTLDSDDLAYRGDYDNSSMADAAVAKGFNYHQGPEWVWPLGYYLRARLRFPASATGPQRRVFKPRQPASAATATAATATGAAATAATAAGAVATAAGAGAGAGAASGSGAGAGSEAQVKAGAVPSKQQPLSSDAANDASIQLGMLASPPQLETSSEDTPEATRALYQWFTAVLRPHRHHLQFSHTGGLPELTNSNGSHCPHSCPVQAWSSATLLDAVYDLHTIVTQMKRAHATEKPSTTPV